MLLNNVIINIIYINKKFKKYEKNSLTFKYIKVIIFFKKYIKIWIFVVRGEERKEKVRIEALLKWCKFSGLDPF